MTSTQKTPKPTILTIFGITGNLARIKLLPALYELEASKQLAKDFYIVGITRRRLEIPQLANELEDELKKNNVSIDKKSINKLFARFYIGKFEITQDNEYPRLRQFLNDIESEKGICFNRLFYLAIPPALFGDIVQKLGTGGLHKGCQHKTHESRLLIEKPFGFDLSSAQELIEVIGRYFGESQVYRIDHYLAKETVMNILRFRHEHPEIEELWNNQYLSNVQITAAEEIGVGSRAEFFEQTGALRDMVQSHLLQILALVAMDLPPRDNSTAIHQQRLELLSRLHPLLPNEIDERVVRGQYKQATRSESKFRSYREEIGNSSSNTETYAALRLDIDYKRWKSVPFYLRAGKRLPEKLTDVTLVFKPSIASSKHSTISIRIQPTQGIAVDVAIHSPDAKSISIQECYNLAKSKLKLDAHARLILNAVQGDQTLFPTAGEVLASWKFIQPILTRWKNSNDSLELYPAGTWGPKGADKLVHYSESKWLGAQINVCPPPKNVKTNHHA